MAARKKPARARPSRSRNGASGKVRRRIVLLLVVTVALAGAWSWWRLQHWTPSLADFPEQGIAVGDGGAPVDLRAAKALGASFAYVTASIGESGRDPGFADYFRTAGEAGMARGAVHLFDPCAPADRQSSNFVTIVPRDPALLPPVIALERTTQDCLEPVGEAAVESELMTLINQIEAHAGKPVILRVSRGFEERYGVARTIERSLWLTRTRLAPDYAGRPWLLWTANARLRSEASGGPVRSVVVRP